MASTLHGSSPLARGLRPQGSKRRGWRRIIPARAGFTRRASLARMAAGDHPRSRGVYAGPQRPGTPTQGSSPLARGLHQAWVGERVRAGIIPARAGFTSASAGSRAARRGSSPLARGLLHAHPVLAPERRIIPARAGFTEGSRPRGRPSRDHPRSRGVYAYGNLDEQAVDGSSPLARGLPVYRYAMTPRPGIIPARAGFTLTRTLYSMRLRDHPRSRGVYAAGGKNVSFFPGSSPLARGLPFSIFNPF